ncbi:LysR family transcriptional regulator [Tamlana haliotis]|uniref:LysR family transcriptional regulator n=1 Tax=Pseudotamlana haliotis TaxID=2614804 RepID=A0A6N6MC18_9FLAO|nr:LysR family transcriptional regulator [Tamlana haliotis]KAB1068160.1 LysR family transcriptional regulator [Tamlana haliotis]
MSNQLEYRHLIYFLAVADELHFRKAADKLFISQPGLSRQIRQMEESMGVILFDRDNRNVSLTKAGEYLKKELKVNLNALDDILNQAKRINDGIDGNLNFGYIGSAMENIIPELLVKLRNKHPNIHFRFQEMDNLNQISALQMKEIDIGFVRIETIPNELNIQPILEDTFSLVLPLKHHLSEQNFTGLKQLQDENFIMFDKSYSPSYYQKIMEIFKESGFTPNVSHRTIHSSSIYKLVEHDFGISIVPSSLRTGINEHVKFIELKDISQRTILSAVWSKNNRNPMLSKMLEFISGI